MIGNDLHSEINDGRAVPRHVAIIMDGNGRWAERRGLPRTAGHRQGVESVRNTVRLAGEVGVEYLTLFSFSSENWSRPKAEIAELFSLLRYFIRRDLAELHENNVKIHIIGLRDGVPEDVLALMDEAKALTQNNTGQNLVIAFNYGARGEITKAMQSIGKKIEMGLLKPEEITDDTVASALDTAGIPDPDLMIRTSGEQRISNFLLWQMAYTELVFANCLWPDFGKEEFMSALDEYGRRTRRFGGLVMETGS